MVVKTYAESWDLQTGVYMVRPADEPLFAVDLDESGRVVVRPLKAGTVCGSTYWKILPDLIPAS
jgi:hypothetical protein